MFGKKTKLQFLLIFFFVLSCSSSDDKNLADFSKKNKIELSALWRFAIDDLNNSLPEEAIEKFKMVEKDYSYTEWAPRSLLMVAYAYYEANRCVDALSVPSSVM
jgi:outer membrane protein assembly factor BamD